MMETPSVIASGAKQSKDRDDYWFAGVSEIASILPALDLAGVSIFGWFRSAHK